MKIQIKNRYDSKVIYECEADTLKKAVEKAVKEGISLEGAYLKEAYLVGASLEGANLYGAYLYEANLRGANLQRADLGWANLYRADLYGANLYGANLKEAYLRGANLQGASLRGANLERADLGEAYLGRANLGGADLEGASLVGANLREADLEGANLVGAYLEGADLTEVKNMPIFQIVPEIGPFYAFKKLQDNIIATLYVPRSAKRINSTGRKCRVSKVKVVALSNNATKAYDKHTGKLLYQVGKWVKPDSFDDDFRKECTNGIHCFITRKEAEEYR